MDWVETWWASLSPRLNGVRAVGVLLLALALLTRFAWWHEAETHYYDLEFGSSLVGGHVLRLVGAVLFALGGLVLIIRHPRIGVPPLPLGDWAIAFCATAVGGALFILGRAWLPADDSGTSVSLTFFALLSAPLWLLGLVSVVLGLRRAPREVAFIKR